MKKGATERDAVVDLALNRALIPSEMAKAICWAALLPRIRRYDFFLFIGPAGSGKSSIAEATGVRAMAKAGFEGGRFIPIACSSMIPGSLMVPFPKPNAYMDGDREVGPHFVNLITKELVLLRPGDHLSLEEVMLAKPESIHEWRNITAPINGHRRLGIFKLPIDILVTGDGNMPSPGADYSTFLQDPADRSRACELPYLANFPPIEGEPIIPKERMMVSEAVNEYIADFARLGVHPATIGFAKRYADLFNNSPTTSWCDQGLSARSLVQADAYLDIEEPMEFVRKLLCGKIGAFAAHAFVQHINEVRIPEPKLIWDGQEPLPVEPGWSYQAAYGVLNYSKTLVPHDIVNRRELDGAYRDIAAKMFDVTLSWPPEILASVWPALDNALYSEKIMSFLNSGLKQSIAWRARHNNARMIARDAWSEPAK